MSSYGSAEERLLNHRGNKEQTIRMLMTTVIARKGHGAWKAAHRIPN